MRTLTVAILIVGKALTLIPSPLFHTSRFPLLARSSFCSFKKLCFKLFYFKLIPQYLSRSNNPPGSAYAIYTTPWLRCYDTAALIYKQPPDSIALTLPEYDELRLAGTYDSIWPRHTSSITKFLMYVAFFWFYCDL